MVMPHRCKPWYRVKPVTRRRLPCRLVGSLGERFAILLRGQAPGVRRRWANSFGWSNIHWTLPIFRLTPAVDGHFKLHPIRGFVCVVVDNNVDKGQ